MWAWLLIAQMGMDGGPGLAEVSEAWEAGDLERALSLVREVDLSPSKASCVHSDLAERTSRFTEAYTAAGRCLEFVGTEGWDTGPVEATVARLEERVSFVYIDHPIDLNVHVDGKLESGRSLLLERGQTIRVAFALSNGSEVTRTVELTSHTVEVSPPPPGAPTISIDDHSVSMDETNNYYGDTKPEGAFPLRTTVQVTGGAVSIAGAAILTVGLVRFFNATQSANENTIWANENGCPDAGPRCDEYEGFIDDRDDARKLAISGGAVLGVGVTTLVLGSLLPKWVGGSVSPQHATLTVEGAF